jgi:uncharacterized RDD family membrane protein YckC
MDVKNKSAYADINIPTQRLFIGPASHIRRLLAFLLDLVIINFVLLWPFEKLLSTLIPANANLLFGTTTISVPLIITLFAIGIVMLLYFTLFELAIGQTPGKIMFDLYVVSTHLKEKEAVKLTPGQIIIRNLFIIPVFPFFLLILVDPIFALFNVNNQRFLEIVSHTIVVQRYIYDNN